VVCGRWQSTQVATLAWLERCHVAYDVDITWQFAQASGSVLRYEVARDTCAVVAPSPPSTPKAA
jgi:hypothetical protein